MFQGEFLFAYDPIHNNSKREYKIEKGESITIDPQLTCSASGYMRFNYKLIPSEDQEIPDFLKINEDENTLKIDYNDFSTLTHNYSLTIGRLRNLFFHIFHL